MKITLGAEYPKIMAKPRMTRRDVWLNPPRPCVERWRNWQAYLQDTYRYVTKGPFFEEPVALAFYFKLKMSDRDLDNLVKGVKDALKGMAWEDDKTKYIPEYDCVRSQSIPKKSKYEILILKIRTLDEERYSE